MSFFLVVGLGLWLFNGSIGNLVFFSLIGLSVGSGFLIHARTKPRKKHIGRKLSLALVGISLFLGAGVFGRQSFQIEGFFFYVLAGVSGGVVIHYLVAKIVGPIFIGRGFCGWGCWIWMVFDYLPWKRSPQRIKGGWPRLRIAHFALSLSLVGLLVYGFKYDHGFVWAGTDGLWWFLAGCSLYYAAGITLAFALKDNRAFCKYVCPVTVFARAGNRLSLLKVSGAKERCSLCGACDKICPMDVKVSRYIYAGTRVLDPECTLCQSCVGACPEGTLGLSLGFDFSTGRVPAQAVPEREHVATRQHN